MAVRFDSMRDSLKRLRKWKFVYLLSFVLMSILFFGYAGYSILYTPKENRLLINQVGGIYTGEDLSKTNVTEGQVKQFTYDVLSKSFDYNYLSFLQDDDYDALVSRKKEQDLPDHRDAIRPYFSPEAHIEFIQELKKSPWMNRFYAQRRQVEVDFTLPPLKTNAGGWVLMKDDRLNISYTGHFFLNTSSKGFKTHIYKVNYDVILERKRIAPYEREDKYYFEPLVPVNTFEWRIKSIEFTSEQRT